MAEAAPPEAPQPRSAGPYIMPDGRPLAAFLDSQLLRPQHGASHGGATQRRRPGAIKEPKEGWTKALPRAATAAAPGLAYSEAEQAELYALSRVGQRKQRRWLNDKLLREMAGTLSAADMASLFKPVPFGEQRASLWEQAARPEHRILFDMFRSLDMDKQTRVLQKWEAHVRELQAGPAAIPDPAIDALAAWAGVSFKARQAMKRAPTTCEAIEAQLLAFLQQQDGGQGSELVVEGLEDGFHRLIAHGLAEYHSLQSTSRVVDGGGKQVVVRCPAHAAARAPQHHLPKVNVEDFSEGDLPAEGLPGAPRVLTIACSDILHLLDDAASLSATTLRHAFVQPLDSSSEAGDHPPSAHDPQQHQHQQEAQHGGQHEKAQHSQYQAPAHRHAVAAS